MGESGKDKIKPEVILDGEEAGLESLEALENQGNESGQEPGDTGHLTKLGGQVVRRTEDLFPHGFATNPTIYFNGTPYTR